MTPFDSFLKKWSATGIIMREMSEELHILLAEEKRAAEKAARVEERERIIDILRPEHPDAIATIRARTAPRGAAEPEVTVEAGSHAGCSYLARPGTVCMKCGKYHPGNVFGGR